MRPFYLSKNSFGYYQVAFVNQETGKHSAYKSTHTSDYGQAMVIATQWLRDGVPSMHALKVVRAGKNDSGIDIPNLASRLSDSEALALLKLLQIRFNVSKSVEPSVVPGKLSAPVSEPVVSTVTDSPKKDVVPRKKVVVIKRSVKAAGVGDGESKSVKNVPRLCQFLNDFWTPEISEYVKKKRARGKSCGDRHCSDMRGIVSRYWIPYFGDDCLVSDVNENSLDDFFFELSDLRKLSGATINHNISCAKVAFEFLFKKGILDVDPMANIERYGTRDAKKRGIPTESEVRKLLNIEWSNYVSFLAFNLSAFSGLRPSEISALRVCDVDIDSDLLHIRHACERYGRLKCTKNGEERDVPVSHDLALKLLARARTNPHFSDTSFIFFSEARDFEPYLPQYYDKGFYEALQEIGISEEQRSERNIVFYSLRHFCATVLSQRADLKTVQSILGHKTLAMTEHYSNHESLEQLRKMKQIVNDGRQFVESFIA